MRPEYADRLVADPNGERTTLDGSKLWQVALLELWLVYEATHFDQDTPPAAPEQH